MPEDGYGWEKLFSERMCRHFLEDYGAADPGRPLPQRLRRARHVGPAAGRRRRPRSAARSRRPRITGEHTHRDLGRRRADPHVHVHRRLRPRHPDDHRRRRPGAGQPRQRRARVASTSWSTSSSRSPASRSSATTTSARRRACAGAAATTPRSCAGTAGRRRPRSRRARAHVRVGLRRGQEGARPVGVRPAGEAGAEKREVDFATPFTLGPMVVSSATAPAAVALPSREDAQTRVVGRGRAVGAEHRVDRRDGVPRPSRSGEAGAAHRRDRTGRLAGPRDRRPIAGCGRPAHGRPDRQPDLRARLVGGGPCSVPGRPLGVRAGDHVGRRRHR